MEITNPPQSVPYITTVGLQRIEVQVVDVGVWDMQTYNTKSIPHGLGSDYTKIIMIEIWIRNDSDTDWKPLMLYNNSADPDLLAGGVIGVTETIVQVQRRDLGQYDDPGYNDGAINRGSMIVWKLV